jgi:hypothetical protein
MTKFADQLWSDLAREHGPALTHAGRPEPGRARRPRSRVIAGSTLALVGAGAAVTVGLTATASTPAFAVTKTGDGSVLVNISQLKSLPDANRKLTEMGIREQVTIDMAAGAAAASGPVTCTPAPGATNLPGPPVKVLVGTNGTQVIESGNTGAGTWHLAACHLTGEVGSGNAGNTGAG